MQILNYGQGLWWNGYGMLKIDPQFMPLNPYVSYSYDYSQSVDMVIDSSHLW